MQHLVVEYNENLHIVVGCNRVKKTVILTKIYR